MKIYHSTTELTDPQALKAQLQSVRAVENAGGNIHVSKSFYHGSAILVLELPEGVDAAGLVPDVEFKEFTGEVKNA